MRTRPRQFAGRKAELAGLEEEVARSRAGALRIVLLTGEAGIGKTALATELLGCVGPETLVLTARAHAFGSSTPFGVWIEALERHLRTLDPDTVARLAGLAAPELAPLLRSVEAASPGQPFRQASSYRLVEDFVSVIAGVAARRPAVVFLDDAHLADSASWETLHFLARDRPVLPMAVIAAARDSELADHRIAADIAFTLEQDGLLHRLRLGSLGRAELDELARRRSGQGAVPTALVDWLEDRSRGNALFATGLLGALLDRGGDLAEPALAAVPDELGDRVRALVRGLDDHSRETLELLAVLGARTEFADLTRLGGRPSDEVAVALDQLVRRRLVREDTSGPVPAFEVAHPLIQDVIYESIGVARRIALHRAVGRTLQASGDLAAAATHLASGASVGDAEAVAALIAALREAEAHSLYRAITAVLGELLRLLPGGDARWLDALAVMDPRADWVLAHLAEDGVVEAYEAMRRIEPLADATGNPWLQGIVQLRLACFASIGLGLQDEALRACHLAADHFRAACEPVLALLADVESLFPLVLQGRPAEALARAEALLPAAQAAGDPLAEIHLSMLFSTQLAYVSRYEESVRAEERGMALARGTGNHYRHALLWNRHRLGLSHLGRVREARALAAGTWESPAAADALANECQCVVDWLAGDLDGALRAMAKARRRNRTVVSFRQTQFLVYGVRAAIDADRLDGIAELFPRLSASRRGFFGVAASLPGWVEGVHDWRLGKPGGLDRLVATIERLATLGAAAESLYCLVDLADAATEGGTDDLAAWAVDHAAAAAQVNGSGLHLALAQLVQAIGTTDADQARLAASTFDELGYRLFHGRAQAALGRALARSEPDSAVAALGAAIGTFQACGAVWPAARTLDALRGIGSRGRKAAAAVAGPAGLSAREWEVARLAAAGMTAPEIAARMFIGERTVESHLQNAYRKLGVRSKRELVARGDEFGLRT